MPSGGSDLPPFQHFQSAYFIVLPSNAEDECLKYQVASDSNLLFPPPQRNKGYLEIAFPPETSYSLSLFSRSLSTLGETVLTCTSMLVLSKHVQVQTLSSSSLSFPQHSMFTSHGPVDSFPPQRTVVCCLIPRPAFFFFFLDV